jgi:hypothetical protein
MKKFLKGTAIAVLVLAVLAIITPTPMLHAAQNYAQQALIKMRFLFDAEQVQGAGVLQTGEDSKLSAAVATAAVRTQVVAAPSAGSVYVRGLLVEKSTGAGGTWTLSYGTGSNCGTGTQVVAGPVTNPLIGYTPLGITIPALNAVCLTPDAATTSIRLFYLD